MFRLARDGSGALAEIIDNGPGIPVAMRPEVFKRFVRLDESRSKPGNGLGLSLVAAIGENHEITIELSHAHRRANRGQVYALRYGVQAPDNPVVPPGSSAPSANL